MNTNTKSIARFIAGTVAAAGILGGGALGFAAGANAATPAAQTRQDPAAEYCSSHQPDGCQRPAGAPARPAKEPKRPSIPGEPPAQGRPARNGV
jgi:hypothetical protein